MRICLNKDNVGRKKGFWTMAYELQPDERETHLNMTGDNHGEWEVFTDDPYWIRRLEKMGIQPFQKVGWGFKYRLSADQVLIRKGKRQVSEATRTAARDRLRNSSTTRNFAT